MPDWAVPPSLNEATEPIYAAFLDLSPSRAVGMGEGAIPLTEVRAYLEMFGHPGCDDVSEFLSLIRACDTAYLHARATKP